MEVTRRAVLAGVAAGPLTRRRRHRVAYAATAGGEGGAAMPVTVANTGTFNGGSFARVAPSSAAAMGATIVTGGIPAGLAAATGAAPAGSMVAKPLTGAFVNASSYPGGLTQAQANTAWETNTGRTLTCRRSYYGAGSIPGSIDTNLTLDVTAGRRAVINIRPKWNGVPSSSPLFGTDQSAAVDTFLASCQAAGLDAVVSVWGEPFGKGLATTDFISFFQHYYPVIHTYYPVAFLTSASSVFNNAEYSYYPGDAYCDIVATDLYYGTWARSGGNGTIISGFASAHGSTSDLAHDPAYQADHASPPKPFGVFEMTTSTDPTSGVSQANATSFWHYIRDAMANRLTLGLPCADVLVFNSQSAPLSNETAIVVADGVTDPNGGFGGVTTEYRNALFASLYDGVK